MLPVSALQVSKGLLPFLHATILKLIYSLSLHISAMNYSLLLIIVILLIGILSDDETPTFRSLTLPSVTCTQNFR